VTVAASAADLVVALAALAVGFVIGSIPLVSPAARGAGPGWVFLGLTADLAKGVIPVALGIVTVSWEIGWIAGIGAILGSARPAFRGSARTNALATAAGVGVALAPPAGAVCAVVGLAVLGVGWLLKRDARGAALALTAVVYPLGFAAVQPDAARLGGLLGLYVVVLLVLRASSRS
jgi:glycerol-3-phosphate acyltransferase PlsY